MKYHVTLIARANVSAIVIIDANDPDKAMEIALNKAHNEAVHFYWDSYDHDTIQVLNIHTIGSRDT